ncbi:MAG TPA: DUF4244 domain-containing protein [Propionicimonas sp.]|nr:DUF4244 domain-containing protein [Propionicimonas sp.]HRA05807.1 DUF4244 domain-containing protein [Propionicimonas sp.]
MAGELVVRRTRDERGMTTAEYAVGTVATVSVVGVIIGILNNPEFSKVIWEIIKAIITVIIQAIAGS